MPPSLPERFADSMRMNHDRWHDGEGYALDLLDEATPEERARIESLILSRTPADWRDIEALARLDSPEAKDRIRRTWEIGDPELRLAIILHAPELVGESEKTELLVSVLRERGVSDGFTQAMLIVENFHPPEVIEALLHNTREREPAIAYDCAAMLLTLHGIIESTYDFSERPFLLRFVEEDREAAYRELRERIGKHD